MARGIVESLPSKYKALSSNSSNAKKSYVRELRFLPFRFLKGLLIFTSSPREDDTVFHLSSTLCRGSMYRKGKFQELLPGSLYWDNSTGQNLPGQWKNSIAYSLNVRNNLLSDRLCLAFSL
jgi:hypothetical protein